MELNARYSHTLHPYFPEDHNGPNTLEGAMLGNTLGPTGAWTANESVFQNNDNMPVGLNPIINNNINANGFDTDMSDRTNPSRHNSSGLSPSTSNSAYPSSSNTSYSPPGVVDDDSLTSAATQQQAQSISTTMEESFKVPPGWDMGSGTGTTPGLTGMTPGGEWEKMMQSMGWEGTGMTPR